MSQPLPMAAVLVGSRTLDEKADIDNGAHFVRGARVDQLTPESVHFSRVNLRSKHQPVNPEKITVGLSELL